MVTAAFTLKWEEGHPYVFSEYPLQRFKAMVLITPDGVIVPLHNRMASLPPLTEAEKKHLDSGKTLLSVHFEPNEKPSILMRRAISDKQMGRGQLVGEVKETFLWGEAVQGMMPPMAELCILDTSGRILFTTLPDEHAFPQEAARNLAKFYSGGVEWGYDNEEYLARYWSIFTRHDFLVPRSIVVMSEARSHVLAPMADFKRAFPLLFLLTLWVVLLLSFHQIRRNLDPLERLKEGTRRIAGRDFSARVTVTSADELHKMRKHTKLGAKILEPISSYAAVVPIVLHHHENFDGTGYPSGLAGEEIPLGARIVAVADQYDAVISDRPYHAGVSREKVVEIIKGGTGTRFDPAVVEAFIVVMEEYKKNPVMIS
jgi:hypothetical protein